MTFDTEDSPFKLFEKMNFSLKIWLKHWYPKICEFLEINMKDDESALHDVLNEIKSNTSAEALRKIISKGKSVMIFAPGVNLELEFEKYSHLFKKKDSILIAADGATTHLLEQDFIPHIIVTDMDGDVDDQFEAQASGSILVTHVHGDNKNVILGNVDKIVRSNFVITTQTNPLPGSENFFGFTDGDRAVCLATSMTEREISLFGFDFGPVIGKYSKNYELDSNMKQRKLKKFIIAKSVINWCTNTGQKFLMDWI